MSPWGRGFDDCARYWKGKKKGHGEDLEGVRAGLSAFRFPTEILHNRDCGRMNECILKSTDPLRGNSRAKWSVPLKEVAISNPSW